MNLKEYGPRAIAFANFLGSYKLDLAHAGLGLGSEVGELIAACSHTEIDENFFTNIIEECGDLIWFANLLAHTKGTTLDAMLDQYGKLPYVTEVRLYTNTGNPPVPEIAMKVCEAADLVKKEFAYDKQVFAGEYGDSLIAMIALIEALLAVIVLTVNQVGFDMLPITLDQVLDANIAKLTARYGDKYSQASALNRDKPSENAAIENVWAAHNAKTAAS